MEREISTLEREDKFDDGLASADAVANTNKDPVVVDEGADSGDSESDEPTSCCSLKTMLIALPNIIIPCLYGYEIGYVGIYATLYSFATNCQLYSAETPCKTLSGTSCEWTGTTCIWSPPHTTCSLAYSSNEEACRADRYCVWNYASGVCGNQVGYKSINSGLFAGSMIIGAMAGSLSAGVMTRLINYPLSFLIIGIISIIASVLTHVSTGTFIYWLLFTARIILGFAMGWQAVISPAYVSYFSPKKLQKMLGTLFQVFTAFGCFVSAVIGICLGNTIKYKEDTNAHVMGRMQGYTAFTTFMAVLVSLLFFVTKKVPKEASTAESSTDYTNLDEAVGTSASAPQPPNVEAQKEKKRNYTTLQVVFLLIMGFVMACTLQLTGINAVMNYAPTIMSNLGLDPLVGNVIVMAWNSATAFGVIPLTRWFSLRTLFLSTTLIGSLACLFLCGVPVYPGVTNIKKVREGVAIAGIAIFIGAYEMGIGPAFFVLAGDLFPMSFRPIGASVTVMIQFIFNVIINICYPIATEGISGGPSGNQDKGQAIAFIFFGCIGLVTVTIEFFFLHPWDESEDDGAPMGVEAAEQESSEGNFDEVAQLDSPAVAEPVKTV